MTAGCTTLVKLPRKPIGVGYGVTLNLCRLGNGERKARKNENTNLLDCMRAAYRVDVVLAGAS